MDQKKPDAADYAGWIGRRTERRDALTPRLAAELEMTLAPNVARVAGAPLGAHWTLAPDIAPMSDLGGDGHPRLGLYLPDLPYPRRMWAGGEIAFRSPLTTGDEVRKVSVVENIVFKDGTSGPLGFVAVRHEYFVGDDLRISERQDLVYRPLTASEAPTKPKPASAPRGELLGAWDFATDPVRLARYSMATFNGHRIHYDAPYAIGVEGYQGLVVHGPLQATLMLHLAADVLGATPSVFRYRGLSPLICGTPCRVEARRERGAAIETLVVAEGGRVTMSGVAEPV
jgi:3-methylfumaryl-CoA hydratase